MYIIILSEICHFALCFILLELLMHTVTVIVTNTNTIAYVSIHSDNIFGDAGH